MEYLKDINISVGFQIDDFYSIPKIVATSFTKYNLKNNKRIYEFDYQGQLKDISPEEFLKKICPNDNHSFELINIEKDSIYPVRLYSTEDIVLQISSYYKTKRELDSPKYINLTILTTNNTYISNVKELCNRHLLREEETSGDEIFLLKSDKNGVSLTPVGTAKTKYIGNNYSPLVREKYAHLTEDLTSNEPCGRLSILSGEPGTGKTFLVKSLLSTELNVSFILVKPDAIESISDPASVPALLQHHNTYDRPIIIVLEDADSCLSTRMGDNMGRLSAILNTSDGILGSTLDIRIIATTNAHKVDFDPAILRPGRLCTHISTDRLSEEQSNEIFTRLTGRDLLEVKTELVKKDFINGASMLGFGQRLKSNPGYLLAEIYKAAYTYNKSIK